MRPHRLYQDGITQEGVPQIGRKAFPKTDEREERMRHMKTVAVIALTAISLSMNAYQYKRIRDTGPDMSAACRRLKVRYDEMKISYDETEFDNELLQERIKKLERGEKGERE